MHKNLPRVSEANYAIQLRSVSKVYKLYGSQRDQLIEVLRLQRFGLRPSSPGKEFSALSALDLSVKKGQRLGVVGRNGSGKTTMLKLICGNFAPTSGEVLVNGKVQALMSVGIGFHPDFTGRENVEASLNYNGLAQKDYKDAIDDIIDFCELGVFIDQPFKAYSLGMQARLMFATATAIRPEILIVDEVLGAGDAYFVAKSKKRVEKLISGGCTMLLVSHSMSQVLELCDRVIWLDQGRIRMEGDPLEVVKCYEEDLQRSVGSLELKASPTMAAANRDEVASDDLSEFDPFSDAHHLSEKRMQTPFFVPHREKPHFPEVVLAGFDDLAPGGLSRWVDEPIIEIIGLAIQTTHNRGKQLVCLEPAQFILDLKINQRGDFHCCYGLAVHDHMGNCVLRLFSPADHFHGEVNERRRVIALLNPCQLGPGEYTLGISVTEHTGAQLLNHGQRYDLLSRSFTLTVNMPDSLNAVAAGFIHSSEWNFTKVGAM